MPRKTLALLCALALAVAYAVPASAFDCTVAKKPTNAGSAALIKDSTGQVTPLKPNPGTDEHIHGGFITFTDGTNSASTFVHAPQGVLPPVRDGGPQHNCDGKGLDALDVCFGE